MSDKIIEGINRYIDGLSQFGMKEQIARDLKNFIIRIMYDFKKNRNKSKTEKTIDGEEILMKLLYNRCENYLLEYKFDSVTSKYKHESFYNDYKDQIYERLNKEALKRSETMTYYITSAGHSFNKNIDLDGMTVEDILYTKVVDYNISNKAVVVKLIYNIIIIDIRDFIKL